MDFQAENAGSGITLGQTHFESLGIRNGGLEPLRITSVTVAGDGFSILEEPPPSIESDVDAHLIIAFKPPDAGRYAGTLHVVSNAQNVPSRDFALSACGMPPDAGTTCTFP